jgi:hypothetical protein
MDPETGEERRQGERRTGERRRGRPGFEDTSQLSIRLSGALHDRVIRTAARRDEDVSTTIRQLLEFALVAEQMLFASRNQ